MKAKMDIPLILMAVAGILSVGAASWKAIIDGKQQNQILKESNEIKDLQLQQKDHTIQIKDKQSEIDNKQIELEKARKQYELLDQKSKNDLNAAQLRLELQASESERKILAAQKETVIKSTAALMYVEMYQAFLDYKTSLERFPSDEMDTTKIAGAFYYQRQKIESAIGRFRGFEPQHSKFQPSFDVLLTAGSELETQYIKYFKLYNPDDYMNFIFVRDYFRNNQTHFFQLIKGLGDLDATFKSSMLN